MVVAQQPAARQLGGTAAGLLAGLVSTLLWCGASSCLIIYNKALYVSGFPYPLMVTGLGQVRRRRCRPMRAWHCAAGMPSAADVRSATLNLAAAPAALPLAR